MRGVGPTQGRPLREIGHELRLVGADLVSALGRSQVRAGRLPSVATASHGLLKKPARPSDSRPFPGPAYVAVGPGGPGKARLSGSSTGRSQPWPPRPAGRGYGDGRARLPTVSTASAPWRPRPEGRGCLEAWLKTPKCRTGGQAPSAHDVIPRPGGNPVGEGRGRGLPGQPRQRHWGVAAGLCFWARFLGIGPIVGDW